jgi:hypothetical protein
VKDEDLKNDCDWGSEITGIERGVVAADDRTMPMPWPSQISSIEKRECTEDLDYYGVAYWRTTGEKSKKI